MPYKDQQVAKAKRKQKYNLIKDSGICSQCKQPWNGTQVMCDCCRSKAEELRKKKRQQRQAAGICGRCGKYPAIEGIKYCTECAEKAKKHKDSEETKKKRLIKYHEVYKPQLQAKRVAFKENGLCADCGNLPPVFGVVCKECYSKRRKWYEHSKLRGSNKALCSGDCVNCRLPWCIDIDDEVVIKLTTEEKQMSRQLDKDAKADEIRQKKMAKKDLNNAKNRYTYAQAIIADIESRREQGETITPREEKKLLNAEKRAIEAKAYVETHSSGLFYL